MAIVIGPTPPGTGVMSDATSFADSKSTSPTRRYPERAEASAIRFMPTSITTAPGRIMSPVTSFARPAATMRISPRNVERSHRLADNVAPADDNAVLSRRIDARRAEELPNPGGRAGDESIPLPDEHLADVHRMEAVHILGGMDAPHHRVGIDLPGQRHLHEDAVDLRIGVQLID